MCMCVYMHEVRMAIGMGQKQVVVVAVGGKTDDRNCVVITSLGEAEPCGKVSKEQENVHPQVCEQSKCIKETSSKNEVDAEAGDIQQE